MLFMCRSPSEKEGYGVICELKISSFRVILLYCVMEADGGSAAFIVHVP